MSQFATVPLHHRHFSGTGNVPLVILHGLFGSGRNWQTVGTELTDEFSVYAPDLRNHGDSPHAEAMGYPVLAADVAAWLDAQGLETIHLLGHSMGGKAAMCLATQWPGRVLSLTIVDIAPKAYREHNSVAFSAMNALNLGAVKSRREADEALLSLGVRDWGMRQFLLTNLASDGTSGFYWKINLPALTAAVPTLVKNPLAPDMRYLGKTLFIRGGKSDFIGDDDDALIHRHFPNARIEMIANSGHNPHIEAREALVSLVRRANGEL